MNTKKKSQGFSVRSVVATGIGAAVFFVLMKFIAIPTGIPNTTINLAEGWLALIAGLFGPVVGLLVGFIGHTLNDAVTYGSPWWSWVIADGIFGLLLGLGKKYLALEYGNLSTKKLIQFNIWQAISNVIVWFIIAPIGDILIYKEAAQKVFLQGAVTAVVNTVSVAIIGSLLLVAYVKSRPKKNSLRNE
ncbi:ECF-type riboflavin transporter substrate-binding protein [Leuconostoc inhae]|uniref:ECF-type riboflavin transporter substrate-binding protein n=1 Tax=Leuconostoc inhae TaxID=178001 RepID=UPI001C7D3436|nr:ECF-type riboflavin transporter substrate-binding protein [Leuconostoc inhae]